jgi:hypothetical protein
MKKILKSMSIVAILIIFLGINSCDKVKEVIPIPSMTATVDNDSWTSIFRASVLFENNGVFSITGTPDASENVDKAIILTINGTTVGTYSIGLETQTSDCLVVYKKTAAAANGSDDYYISRTATITLSEVNTDNKRISGTFSATLVPSNNPLGTEITITNGTFENLNYTVEQ